MSSPPHIMCMRVQCSVRVVIDCVTVTVGYLRSPFESNAEKTNVDGSGARSIGPAPCLAVYGYSSRQPWRRRTAVTEEWQRVIRDRALESWFWLTRRWLRVQRLKRIWAYLGHWLGTLKYGGGKDERPGNGGGAASTAGRSGQDSRRKC